MFFTAFSFVNTINHDAEGFSALPGRQQFLIFMSTLEYPQHRKICWGNKWDTIWNILKGWDILSLPVRIKVD
jgi:hypothetical protein